MKKLVAVVAFSLIAGSAFAGNGHGNGHGHNHCPPKSKPHTQECNKCPKGFEQTIKCAYGIDYKKCGCYSSPIKK